MNIKLKEDALQDVLANIETWGFTSDGCGCGEWGYELNKNLHIYVYRSCRKSNNTPDEKLWHIHDMQFFKSADYLVQEYKGREYMEAVEVEEEDEIFNVKLDEHQKLLIVNRLREITLDIYESEYRCQF